MAALLAADARSHFSDHNVFFCQCPPQISKAIVWELIGADNRKEGFSDVDTLCVSVQDNFKICLQRILPRRKDKTPPISMCRRLCISSETV